MNDPHVEYLTYAIRSLEDSDYYDSSRFSPMVLGQFEVNISGMQLTATPVAHYSSESSARSELDPFLLAWQEWALLSPARHRVIFEFEKSHVIDRQPTPGAIQASIGAIAVTSNNVVLRRNFSEFPAPPNNYTSSAITREMVTRYQRFLQGGEPICSFGYWVLTSLEQEYGGKSGRRRMKTAGLLLTEEKVLNELGRLTAIDDPVHGRKAGGPTDTHLSHEESRWIERACVLLIRRVGELRADNQELSTIAFEDLASDAE